MGNFYIKLLRELKKNDYINNKTSILCEKEVLKNVHIKKYETTKFIITLNLN